MTNPWIPILEKLPLSRAEDAAVKRYEQDPMGRSFLPVADILRSHKRIEESLELLTQGVERHATFTVARVVLARELLLKGLVIQAWQTLEDSPMALDDNVLAQKLRFKLALLVEKGDLAVDILAALKKHEMLDNDTAEIGEVLTLSGAEKAKERIVRDYRTIGIKLSLPQPGELVDESEPESPRGEVTSDGWDPDEKTDVAKGAVDPLSGFQVMPLGEIFQGGQAGLDGDVGKAPELDTTTLAEIYCKQGHYTKALSMYRRMLRLTPNNDYLKQKVREVALLEKEQRSDDLTVDPAVVDQMETMEIIDTQAQLFNDLLERLQRQNAEKP